MGLTQGEAAVAVGVGQQYISNLERGQNQPSVLALIAALASQYETSTDYLLGLVDDPAPNMGAEWPAYAREIINVLERLPESRRAELVAIAETLAQIDVKRAEDDAQVERMAEMIEARLSDAGMDALSAILEASVASGDVAAARDEIIRLLTEKQKVESQRQE